MILHRGKSPFRMHQSGRKKLTCGVQNPYAQVGSNALPEGRERLLDCAPCRLRGPFGVQVDESNAETGFAGGQTRREWGKGMRSAWNLGIVASMLVACTSIAHGATLYATGDDPDILYTINTANGTLTPIGGYSLVSGADEYAIGGLEFSPSGVLYGVSIGSIGRLYTISLANGQATSVGLTNQFTFEGGLAFDPITGVAYMANGNTASSPSLSTVNLLTGNATKVGQIGNASHDFAGFAFSPTGQLYGIDRITNALWAIDKSNPAGAGTVQVGAGLGGGIALGPVGGMTYDAQSGVYWGYASMSKSLFTIDIATGAGTVVYQFTGPEDPVLWSLASPNVIPEPGTLAMLAVGAAVCVRRRRR